MFYLLKSVCEWYVLPSNKHCEVLVSCSDKNEITKCDFLESQKWAPNKRMQVNGTACNSKRFSNILKRIQKLQERIKMMQVYSFAVNFRRQNSQKLSLFSLFTFDPPCHCAKCASPRPCNDVQLLLVVCCFCLLIVSGLWVVAIF